MHDELKQKLRAAYLAAAKAGQVAANIEVGEKFAAANGIHATSIDLDVVELPIKFVEGGSIALRVVTTKTELIEMAQ